MLKSKRTPILKPPTPQKKYEIIINSEQCDGCQICIEFCPKNLLQLSENKCNSRMLHYVEIINSEDCLGCKQCERLCPTASLFIREIDLLQESANH
jgi:2-oxoglutarate ferredoxin oxidoreductase subunit delta